MNTYERSILKQLTARLSEARRFIQVLVGPRQVGKTTLAGQLIERVKLPCHYVSADEPTLQDRVWLSQQWDIARAKASMGDKRREVLLVIDEVQKIQEWDEVVKRLWDEDTMKGLPVKLLLLGSSAWLIQKGLTESLAGRFELNTVMHWSFTEMKKAFGYTLDQYVIFGGYPGAASLIGEPKRWRHYVVDSLIETTISRDVLLMTRVDKPILLRRLFHLGCLYSGQILSYQKMLGQLQDAGNTTTLAHYLTLLSGSGLLTGVPKYAGGVARRRASSPKFNVFNTALMSALSDWDLLTVRQRPQKYGRLIESCIGSHLINGAAHSSIEVYYWRERNREVDFVLAFGDQLVAIEVKSGLGKQSLPGMEAFCRAFDVTRRLLVGGQGIDLEEFLSFPTDSWFE